MTYSRGRASWLALKRDCLQTAGAPLRLAAARDQSRAPEHTQMFGCGEKSHGERLGKLSHADLVGSKAGENSTPGGPASAAKVTGGGSGVKCADYVFGLPGGPQLTQHD